MTDHAQNLPVVVPAPLVFTFTNGKPHAVRVMTDAQGEPLFHVGDLCDLLEHTNPSRAISQHVEKDDLTKRYVIDRLGRKQSANFVTEPGMWSLVLGSHAPNAKKVKRWVVSDVLPAIRKTGRYQAPQAAPEPAPAPDYLTPNDMANLARCIDYIQRDKRMPQAWRFSFWKAIRRVTRTKSPDKLEVRHLPDVADEALRIYTAVAILDTAIRKVEKEVLRRVFRNGEEAEQVVAQIEARILAQSVTDAANMTKALDAWQRRDVQALRDRTTAYLSVAHYPEGLEPKEVAAC